MVFIGLFLLNFHPDTPFRGWGGLTRSFRSSLFERLFSYFYPSCKAFWEAVPVDDITVIFVRVRETSNQLSLISKTLLFFASLFLFDFIVCQLSCLFMDKVVTNQYFVFCVIINNPVRIITLQFMASTYFEFWIIFRRFSFWHLSISPHWCVQHWKLGRVFGRGRVSVTAIHLLVTKVWDRQNE